ncbi:MAG: hypothetical protein PHN45_06795 [Methylococcales bacterium]|nr:hypothetical protein [Methylococcales bacterium]MDD5754444.1 hypothetical protein [Methylococcales bacterium]
MNRPVILVLIALNTLLVAVLTIEWVAGTKTPTTIAQTKTDNSESEESLPELDLTTTSEEGYSDLVERPLFIKGRKTVNEPIPESVPVAAVKKVEAFVWDLTGVFATPKGVTAFFSRMNAKVPKDNYRKYKVGEELDGWKISEIHTDSVVLTQTSETKTLPLRKLKPRTPVPMQMNVNNRVPPPQHQPVPPQMQQQGMPPQNLQTPDAVQNNVEPQADESAETVQQ